MRVNTGQWSDTAVASIPDVITCLSILLTNTLSIRVAEECVTRVGLLIAGKRAWENIVSRNLEVGPWLWAFNKLRV